VNRILPLVPLALLLAACGAEPADTSASAPGAPGATPVTASFLLPADVPDAVPVLDAMKGEEGKEVAIVGKVQKISNKGRAGFFLTDESVKDCLRSSNNCGCKTPWDYCCHEKEMQRSTMLVELRGADGLPAKVQDIGIRELDLVAVRGTLAKGPGDRLMLVAKDGWYRRERPKVPASIKFP
jgi:hypothetical protein